MLSAMFAPLSSQGLACLNRYWPFLGDLIIQIISWVGEEALVPRHARREARRLLRGAEAMLRRLAVLILIQDPDAYAPAEVAPRVKTDKPVDADTGKELPKKPKLSFPLCEPLSLVIQEPQFSNTGKYSFAEDAELVPVGQILSRLELVSDIYADPEILVRRLARYLSRKDRPKRRATIFRPGVPPGHQKAPGAATLSEALVSVGYFADIALAPG